MLSDFLHTLVEFIQFLWPLRIVHPWERALYMAFGKVRREVGPGIYFRFPWFTEVHEVSTTWESMYTGRNDITTKDQRTLSFSASAMIRVVDVHKAVLVVHDASSTMAGLLSAVLAEKLAEVEPERFSPERRGRLNSSLAQWVETEAAEFGVEVKWIRFTSFVLNPKTIRLLTESTGSFH